MAAVLIAGKNDITIEIGEGFSVFAVLYIVAQGIERLLQPLTEVTFQAHKLQTAKRELAAAKQEAATAQTPEQTTAQTPEQKAAAAVNVQAKQDVVDGIQANRTVILWTAATVIALLVSAFMELGLIQSVAHVTGSNGTTPDWFQRADVVVTGIAIGAGTKPLHDLISRLESAKTSADPATQPPAST